MNGQEVIRNARYATILLTADFTFRTGRGTFEAAGIVYGEESGRFRIRLYRYGMVSADLIVTPEGISGLPDSADEDALRRLAPLLRPLLFWWTAFSPADMAGRETAGPVFSNMNAVTRMDGPHLLPLEQIFTVAGQTFRVEYTDPRRAEERWFPNRISVRGPDVTGTITVDRARLDAPFGEEVFTP